VQLFSKWKKESQGSYLSKDSTIGHKEQEVKERLEIWLFILF